MRKENNISRVKIKYEKGNNAKTMKVKNLNPLYLSHDCG